MKIKPITDIDLGNLEVECVRQVRLFGRNAKWLADAKKDLAELEAEQEVVEAEVIRAIRRNPAKFEVVGGSRGPTEGAIKERMVLHPRYKEIKAKIIEAKHAVDVLAGRATTLEHRKRMIEKSIDLFLADYFARPKTKGNKDFDGSDIETKRRNRPKLKGK